MTLLSFKTSVSSSLNQAWDSLPHRFVVKMYLGFPSGASGTGPACQCRRHKRCRFNPWVRKICWRRVRQLAPVFLTGKSLGQMSLVGCESMGSQRVWHDWSDLAHTTGWDKVCAHVWFLGMLSHQELLLFLMIGLLAFGYYFCLTKKSNTSRNDFIL